MFNFSAINLGCTKNLVDLEFSIWEILKLSKTEEINFFTEPEAPEVEYLIINTCWFLSSSREEAEQTIKFYDEMWKKIIIIGCYVPVKDDNFIENLKNLHSIIDYDEHKNLAKVLLENNKNSDKIEEKQSEIKNNIKLNLSNFKKEKLKSYLEKIAWDNIKNPAFIWDSENTRAYLNADFWYEYLKIAEWCNNSCSFCIIPNIRWKQKSRTIEDIVKEVKIMLQNGIKEIQIISQDTTRYWVDLYNKPMLLDLLEEIDKIPGNFKYRIYYIYPDILTFSNLERLKNLKKMIPYFDFPFQHISRKILKNMWRFYDENHIHKILDFIKNNWKQAYIHTNFIIWFPWETEKDFRELIDFAKKYEFQSVGIFGYHDEPLAKSYKLENKIDDKTIEVRVAKMKKVLDKIYSKQEKARKKQKQIWYIHEIWDDFLVIRPEIKAPEVDFYDEVEYKKIISGNVEIGEKVEYEL